MLMESRTYTYRIHPDIDQEAKMLDWLEQCRRAGGVTTPLNYALYAFHGCQTFLIKW